MYTQCCEPIIESRFFVVFYCRFQKTENRLDSIFGVLPTETDRIRRFLTEKPCGLELGLFLCCKPKPTDFFGETRKPTEAFPFSVHNSDLYLNLGYVLGFFRNPYLVG